jgi:hypothetical protein
MNEASNEANHKGWNRVVELRGSDRRLLCRNAGNASSGIGQVDQQERAYQGQ